MKAISTPLGDRKGSFDTAFSNQGSQRSCSLAHGRSSSHNKTLYQLARPAVHVRFACRRMRPKLLLQLQQISHTGRPILLLDLSPSTILMPLLARGFTIFFGRWKCLGPGDMTIVKRELSSVEGPDMHSETTASTNQGKEERDIVARICHSSSGPASAPGDAKIYLSSGTLCETHTLPSGSYEIFYHSGRSVQIMRWVLRHSKNRRSSTSAHRDNVSPLFTFSIIDPGARRHAVIASMTKEHIEVSQEYCPLDTENPCYGGLHITCRDFLHMLTNT